MVESSDICELSWTISIQSELCCIYYRAASVSESVEFSAAVTEDYYAEAWVLV